MCDDGGRMPVRPTGKSMEGCLISGKRIVQCLQIVGRNINGDAINGEKLTLAMRSTRYILLIHIAVRSCLRPIVCSHISSTKGKLCSRDVHWSAFLNETIRSFSRGDALNGLRGGGGGGGD